MSNANHLVEMNAKISNPNETAVIRKQGHFSGAVCAVIKERRVMKHPGYRQGMTLVEVLLAVAIIGLLAVLVVPAINLAIRSRENAECARKLRTAVLAFEMYAAEVGSYPANRYSGVIPPEMADYYFPYFKIDWWESASELGGGWNWNNDYHFKYSVSISSPTASAEHLAEFDRLVDDGNLDTGNFCKVGSQYHFILEK